MKVTNKRSGISSVVAILVILVILLAAVAGYAGLVYKATPSTVTTTISTVSTSNANALAKLKVAMIVPISNSDASWNYQAEHEISVLKAQYGFSLSITENKFDGTSAQPVAQQYASQGYNVVILQGNQYQVMANTIAPQYPKTLFVCVDCFQANYSNIYRIWYDLGGGGFIEGFMAGMLTHTNTIGMIGGGRVASIWAGHEGFKLGALYANSNVKFTEKYEAFSWADSAGAQSDASLMYTNGADIVFSSGDGIDVGVVGAALAITNPSGYSTSNPSLKIWATTVYANETQARPAADSVLLGSIVVDWGPLFNDALVAYVSGTSSFGYVSATMDSGLIQVQPGPNVPTKIAAMAMVLQSLIVQDSITLYTATNPATANPLCFDQPGLAQCADTSVATAAMQANYLPPVSSL